MTDFLILKFTRCSFSYCLSPPGIWIRVPTEVADHIDINHVVRKPSSDRSQSNIRSALKKPSKRPPYKGKPHFNFLTKLTILNILVKLFPM